MGGGAVAVYSILYGLYSVIFTVGTAVTMSLTSPQFASQLTDAKDYMVDSLNATVQAPRYVFHALGAPIENSVLRFVQPVWDPQNGAAQQVPTYVPPTAPRPHMFDDTLLPREFLPWYLRWPVNGLSWFWRTVSPMLAPLVEELTRAFFASTLVMVLVIQLLLAFWFGLRKFGNMVAAWTGWTWCKVPERQLKPPFLVMLVWLLILFHACLIWFLCHVCSLAGAHFELIKGYVFDLYANWCWGYDAIQPAVERDEKLTKKLLNMKSAMKQYIHNSATKSAADRAAAGNNTKDLKTDHELFLESAEKFRQERVTLSRGSWLWFGQLRGFVVWKGSVWWRNGPTAPLPLDGLQLAWEWSSLSAQAPATLKLCLIGVDKVSEGITFPPAVFGLLCFGEQSSLGFGEPVEHKPEFVFDLEIEVPATVKGAAPTRVGPPRTSSVLAKRVAGLPKLDSADDLDDDDKAPVAAASSTASAKTAAKTAKSTSASSATTTPSTASQSTSSSSATAAAAPPATRATTPSATTSSSARSASGNRALVVAPTDNDEVTALRTAVALEKQASAALRQQQEEMMQRLAVLERRTQRPATAGLVESARDSPVLSEEILSAAPKQQHIQQLAQTLPRSSNTAAATAAPANNRPASSGATRTPSGNLRSGSSSKQQQQQQQQQQQKRTNSSGKPNASAATSATTDAPVVLHGHVMTPHGPHPCWALAAAVGIHEAVIRVALTSQFSEAATNFADPAWVAAHGAKFVTDATVAKYPQARDGPFVAREAFNATAAALLVAPGKPLSKLAKCGSRTPLHIHPFARFDITAHRRAHHVTALTRVVEDGDKDDPASWRSTESPQLLPPTLSESRHFAWLMTPRPAKDAKRSIPGSGSKRDGDDNNDNSDDDSDDPGDGDPPASGSQQQQHQAAASSTASARQQRTLNTAAAATFSAARNMVFNAPSHSASATAACATRREAAANNNNNNIHAPEQKSQSDIFRSRHVAPRRGGAQGGAFPGSAAVGRRVTVPEAASDVAQHGAGNVVAAAARSAAPANDAQGAPRAAEVAADSRHPALVGAAIADSASSLAPADVLQGTDEPGRSVRDAWEVRSQSRLPPALERVLDVAAGEDRVAASGDRVAAGESGCSNARRHRRCDGCVTGRSGDAHLPDAALVELCEEGRRRQAQDGGRAAAGQRSADPVHSAGQGCARAEGQVPHHNTLPAGVAFGARGLSPLAAPWYPPLQVVAGLEQRGSGGAPQGQHCSQLPFSASRSAADNRSNTGSVGANTHGDVRSSQRADVASVPRLESDQRGGASSSTGRREGPVGGSSTSHSMTPFCASSSSPLLSALSPSSSSSSSAALALPAPRSRAATTTTTTTSSSSSANTALSVPLPASSRYNLDLASRHPPRTSDILHGSRTAPNHATNTESRSWPAHIKPLARRIDMDTLARLPGTDDSTAAVSLARKYLEDDSLYATHLPRRTFRDAPVAKLEPHHAQPLLDAGIVEPVDKNDVRGRIFVFAVPEPAKQRFRVIQHTADANASLPPAPSVAFTALHDRCAHVHAGSHAVQVDFKAFYTQFVLSPAVRSYFCHRLAMPDGRTQLVRLCVGPTGQAHTVFTAVATTRHLLAFHHRSAASDDHIDNVLFVGDAASVMQDLRVLANRCDLVGVTINEDTSRPQDLVATELDWCGLHLNFTTKCVSLTQKLVDKVKLSWSLRDGWTWRGFSSHIGLLFYSMQVISVPVAEFFNLLRFISEVARAMQAVADTQWDCDAVIWPSAWIGLQRWTEIALANKPRLVPDSRAADVLVLVDSSSHGYGYVALDLQTGETYQHGAQWTPEFARKHGQHKLRRSVFTEPWGILLMKRHLTAQIGADRVLRIGTDSQTAAATHRRGFSGRSFDLNEVARADREEFPLLRCEYVHIPGVQNGLADALSRGAIASKASGLDIQMSLRRLLGVNPADCSNGGG